MGRIKDNVMAYSHILLTYWLWNYHFKCTIIIDWSAQVIAKEWLSGATPSILYPTFALMWLYESAKTTHSNFDLLTTTTLTGQSWQDREITKYHPHWTERSCLEKNLSFVYYDKSIYTRHLICRR